MAHATSDDELFKPVYRLMKLAAMYPHVSVADIPTDVGPARRAAYDLSLTNLVVPGFSWVAYAGV
jgi:hypothetical protein